MAALLLLIFLLFSISTPLASSNNVSEQQWLLGFKAGITTDPSASLSNWNSRTPLCNWTGISCTSTPTSQSVAALNLSLLTLKGTISPLLGNLSSLELLNLSNNAFVGHIPPQLGQLSRLQILSLHGNQLQGTIPPALSRCRNLYELRLSHNGLHGSIPPELSLLSSLKYLHLKRNYLAGSIPSSLGNDSALVELDLGENNLEGPIPQELGTLAQLQMLHLGTNKLSGTIPLSLTNLSKLNDLGLYQNQLRGHTPWEIGTKLTRLQILKLWGNRLTGNIPNSIGNCSNLTIINLSRNQLSGMVPTELGRLSLLKTLKLHKNQLVSGSGGTLAFLTSLINCSHLEELRVGNNYLTGVFPQSIGQLSAKLGILALPFNMISGSIPQQIANLTNLTYLGLDHNLLSGNIPSGITRFHKLERLFLHWNRLEGSIPSEIGQMQCLGLLSLGRNNLSGNIPDSLCSLQQLRRLSLHHNYLSGDIPASLQGCQYLELLDLSYNNLRGRIPREVIANLENLQFYLNLSWNSLQGSLPREISKIAMAQAIDISGNQLQGMIPNALGDCTALENLNLSHNAFEGPIPDTLSKLQNLQEMDLSANILSGSIPTSLRRLKVLQYINLSSNNLSGQIQEEGLFPNSTVITLLMGNPGLCGPQNYSLPACPKKRQGNCPLLRNIVLSAVGIITFSMLFNLGRGVEDLVTATNGFDKANLLGVGNFGSVYKGNVNDGKDVVAIKVLNLQNEEAHKSFKTECKVLARIRHRNLIRIISAFSYPGLIGLVVQFASNGSLEKQLYPDRDEQEICELGLRERLNIAIDVAHGMEYLHHDCSPQVVHCDLKPGNVLLDSDMTALVTDFGISRLTTTPNTRDVPSTTTIAFKGSIGYIAPEYGVGGVGGSVSTKGDVYSYGILI